jgi:translation elongation factor EF-Tu-like GTPase
MLTDDLIIVKAKITMKTTEEGGRKSGFKSGYRPNHVFEITDDLKNLKTYIGDINFDDQELIQPGETKIVTVRFLKMPQVEKYIIVGQKWFINEAARTLGFGEILEIYN